MDEKLFNKIQHTYTFLNDQYGNSPRDYFYPIDNYYKAYSIERFKIREDVLDVILQMKDIPFASLFNESYKKTFPEKSTFNDGNCSINYETHIAVHWDVQLILYYYLVNNLIDDIKELVSILKSMDIEDKFKGFIKRNDNEVRYNMMVHEEINKYIERNVPNYKQLIFIFNRVSNNIYIENSSIVFKTNAMLSLIESNSRVHDFTNLNIE